MTSERCWLREAESNRPCWLMRPDWSHSSYPATTAYAYSVVKEQWHGPCLAQGGGLEPPLAGLESAVLPAYTNPARTTASTQAGARPPQIESKFFFLGELLPAQGSEPGILEAHEDRAVVFA